MYKTNKNMQIESNNFCCCCFCFQIAHPHYFNQISCGLDIVSLAGEWLTAAANTNMYDFVLLYSTVFILSDY